MGQFPPPQYFFYLRLFFTTKFKKDQKHWCKNGGNGCVYIMDWFKPTFPVCLT